VAAPQETWLFTLYVAGASLSSRNALAAEHGVVAVPMVVRESPVPIRKVVGDLSNIEVALRVLQFAASPRSLLRRVV
jgi:KaiB domain